MRKRVLQKKGNRAITGVIKTRRRSIVTKKGCI